MPQPNRTRSTEPCRHCNETEVVPVLDKGIEERAKAGNKYRQFCLACHRWLPMCSTAHYETHPNPHVLPVGAEPVAENLITRSSFHDSDPTDIDRQPRSRDSNLESRGQPNSASSVESPNTDIEFGFYSSTNGSRLVVTFPLSEQRSDSLSEYFLSDDITIEEIDNAIRNALSEELNK